jgi:carbonic anhydrase
VHGWIYGLHDGLLRDLNVSASSLEEAQLARQSVAQQASGSPRS